MRQGSILRNLLVVLACGLAAAFVAESASAHNVRFGGTLTAKERGEVQTKAACAVRRFAVGSV